MIVFELTGTEGNSEYRRLESNNSLRQLNFLSSLVMTAVNLDRRFLSQTIIKALNYHAIACLHVNAGEYRPCPVTVGGFRPPEHYRVAALMDDFVNRVNMNWENIDMFVLSAYVLWKLNYIHPFINGNGRTARACCYFVLCVKAGGILPGRKILPQLLQENREQYIDALRHADTMLVDELSSEALVPLTGLIRNLINEQLSVHSDH